MQLLHNKWGHPSNSKRVGPAAASILCAHLALQSGSERIPLSSWHCAPCTSSSLGLGYPCRLPPRLSAPATPQRGSFSCRLLLGYTLLGPADWRASTVGSVAH
eukprot:1920597-Rhodomonas_salina.1